LNFKKTFFPNDGKSHHIKSLDGLRGFAVLIVLVSHGSDLGLPLLPFIDFSFFGRVGVYLFFIISAYLLDRQIILALKESKDNFRFWANYTIRRFLRIYPLLIISLLTYLVLNSFSVRSQINSFSRIWEVLLLKDERLFYWSIIPEFKYYLISPLILLFIRVIFKWKIYPTLIFILMSGIISHYLVWKHDGYLKWIYLYKSLPVFLTGTIFAFIEIYKPKLLSSFPKKKLIGILCFILLFSTIPSFWKMHFNAHIPVHTYIFILPYIIILSGIFISIRYGNGIINKIFENPFLRVVGNISFSLYLFHWATAILILKFFPPDSIISSVLYYVFSILISMISFKYIEYPLSKIRLKKYKY